MYLSQNSKIVSLILGVVVLLVTGALLINLYLSGNLTIYQEKTLTLENLLNWNVEQLFILAWEFFWVIVFVFAVYAVIKRAKTRQTTSVIHFLEKIEKVWVLIALVGLMALATITIPIAAPYLYGPQGKFATENAQVLNIVASQFSFSITNANGSAHTSNTKLNSNEFIKFNMTTSGSGGPGTTHGFGLYDETNHLIIQAQIVPGFVNTIVTKLATGTYKVVCMEFCGSGHHLMRPPYLSSYIYVA